MLAANLTKLTQNFPRNCNCCKGKGIIYDRQLGFVTCPIAGCKNGVITKLTVTYEYLKNISFGKPSNSPECKLLEEISLLV